MREKSTCDRWKIAFSFVINSYFDYFFNNSDSWRLCQDLTLLVAQLYVMVAPYYISLITCNFINNCFAFILLIYTDQRNINVR